VIAFLIGGLEERRQHAPGADFLPARRRQQGK
jgi:hypothetical protein